MPRTTSRITIPLGELGCGSGEVRAVERELARLTGVTRVYANPLTEMAYVEYDAAICTPADLTAAVRRSGHAEHGSSGAAHESPVSHARIPFAVPRTHASTRNIPMRSDQLRLDATAFGLAAATVTAAVFALCALAVAVAPAWATAAASNLFHLDVTQLARSITWGGFVVGLICWSIASWLAFAAVAGLYNRYLGRRGAVARTDVAAHGVA
ncbi:MAG TPA: DUF5676 family membrane protein [Gemmatimonadaceae bacterium]|nr:DUF5676 family membrane protein [Gemmatimonadaceae bacterium]